MFNGEIILLVGEKTLFGLHKKASGFLYEAKKPYVKSAFISARLSVRYEKPETKPFIRLS
jgi:hypothetical protein